MKKFSRVLLYSLGAIVGLFLFLLLVVNIYVQSARTQRRIEDELSQRLGTTLRIQRISVTPWWGLKLRGITIPQTDPKIERDFLHADTFRLRIRFLSLFARELVIKEVSLVNPTVVWAQNSDGKWRIPSLPQEAVVEQATAPPAPQTTPPGTSETAPQTAAIPSRETEEPSPSFTPEVRRVHLVNGNFHFLDNKGRPVAAFEGLAFKSNLRRTTELRGDASISRISLRNRFFLADLKSPVRYDPTQLEFSNIHAKSANGEITGHFSMAQSEPGSPFDAQVNFRDLQADQLVSDAGGPKGMVQGRLEGSLQARGKTADPNALEGAGEIYLRDGQLRQYSLLVALAQILQIDELSQLHFEQAHVKYHITPGVVNVDELMLSSQNLRVAAHGTIGFDGKLRLASQLAIDDRVRSQLFRGMQAAFRPTDDPAFAAVDFNVTGSVEKPKTDLMNKLVGRDLKDLGGIIGGLLGGGKHKSRPAATEPAPNEQSNAPVESPVPPNEQSPAPAEPEPSATP